MKVLALVLPLLAVVVVSGCTTGGTSVSTGNGIVIEEFKPSLTTTNSGNPINLLLKLENQGEADAIDVEALIFNINTNECDVSDEDKNLGDMLGVDAFTSTAGATRQTQWSGLEAPMLPSQLTHTYTPMVRVSYDYTTSAYKPITIVDRDELIALIQGGENLPRGTTTYTAGPLSVDLTVTDYTVSPDESGIDPFNLNIKITNLWWGSNGKVIFDGFGDSDDAYPLEMRITLPDELRITSDWDESGCSESWDEITLWDGHTGEITCELEISDEPEIRTEGLIQVDLQYRFAIDDSTTIVVTGTSGI
jgi:hypothetical protein